MKYKCLVLDHDDTAVNSTPYVHYPAFIAIMEELRPKEKPLSLEGFLHLSLGSGILNYYTDTMRFTKKEMEREKELWHSFIRKTIPPFFDGMPEIIRRQKAEGGYVCVVTHSFAEYVERDYRAADLPVPDLIFGWGDDPTRCKPYPYPLEEIMRITGCTPRDILTVDDLRPGMEMTHACGADFAACGWGYDIPSVREYMEKEAEYYLTSVAELEALQFGGAE